MDATHLRTGSSAPVDGAAAPSTSASGADGDDADSAGGPAGAKVWLVVLLFALLLLPFLPSAARRGGGSWSSGGGGGGGYRRGGINFKSGWDVVNLCLVLFAILCGLLGRAGGGDGEAESPNTEASTAGKKEQPRQMSPAPAVTAPWETESYGSFSAHPGVQQDRARTGIRRMKSSSSYPELRLGGDGVWALASPDAAWRFRDDAELYRVRRPELRQERTWEWDVRAPEVKTITVDTVVERRGSPPREPRRRRTSVERIPAPRMEEERLQTMEAASVPARSRRWSAGALDAMHEQQAAPVEVVQPAEPQPPPPAPPRRRRRSLEMLPRPEELEAEVTVDEVRNPSQPPRAPRPRRRGRSVENLPRPEELEREIVVEEVRNPLPPPPAMFPPGTPPPPQTPRRPSTSSRSKKKRNGSVGGAKELASAIALFYQRKRKSITMKAKRRPHYNHHHSDDRFSPPPSDESASPDAPTRTNNAAPLPPPPQPPPPSSIFSNLFKKGSKSQRFHSVAPPLPPTRRSKKLPTPSSRPAPPAPPPPPVRTRAHTQSDPQQTPMYPRRVYYTYYPLPPPSPPLPPPPPPQPLVSEGEDDAPSVTASPAPAYCASPDVNAKADKFIESFREGLKLEKLNSYREKWQRRIQEEAAVTVAEDEDGEFMVIGSLFGDDNEDDISLPETPAIAAVAVGV